MRHGLIFTVFFLFSASFNFLDALDASVTHASFRANTQGFVEIYLQVIGSSVEFAKVDEYNQKASVLVTLLISNEEGVVRADKFVLNSPVTPEIVDFIDLKRYSIQNGTYTMMVEFLDQNDKTNNLKIETPLVLDYNFSGFEQSDIQLLSSCKMEDGNSPFHKHGLFMEPLPYQFYHRYTNTLTFYSELYGANNFDDDFMITYSVNEMVNGELKMVESVSKRLSPKEVIPLIHRMDIKHLLSGNYLFKVEVLNREQELLSSKSIEFNRSNPSEDIARKYYESDPTTDRSWIDVMSEEELRYSLKAIMPILSFQEVETLNYLLDESSSEYQRNYLYHYWSSQFEINPQAAYGEYMKVAKAIDNMYDYGFGYGFETDRGHMYLKYGRPDDIITVQNDNGAFPYEIWYYNRMEHSSQSNTRSIFYNPSYASKAFVLLHSTIRGEKRNPRWEVDLYRGSFNEQASSNTIDETKAKESFRRQARELFEN